MPCDSWTASRAELMMIALYSSGRLWNQASLTTQVAVLYTWPLQVV